jgi:adenylate cyclase
MPVKEVKPERKNKEFSISLRGLMITGFGGLVLISVGLVLFMSVSANFANTHSLLNERALSLLNNMESSIRIQTDQAERTLLAVAKLYDGGQLTINTVNETQTLPQQNILQGIMTASPIVEVLLIVDTNKWQTGIYRTPDGKFGSLEAEIDDSEDFTALGSDDKTLDYTRPVWGEPKTFDNILYHVVGLPLKKQGKLTGYVFAAIGQQSMNRVVANLGDDNDTTAFVLSSNNKVIAHSDMSEYLKMYSDVSLSDFPDEPLRHFAESNIIGLHDPDKKIDMEIRESGRGSGYIYITRQLAGYSKQPYILGAYFAKTAIGTEIVRAVYSAVAGLFALALAVLTSIFLARRLSLPMHRISKVANDFSNLKLDNFFPLPGSRIREIDEQSHAMNSMHTTLSEFTQYLPRSLVKRLMEPGSSAIRTVEREITILFADIVGFTTMSEGLNAIETANLLNTHFETICSEITRHKGTVDKFIGDGVMAFWGAPDADDDQAKNALMAARDIVEAIKNQNIVNGKNDLPQMRIRIGIHTGRVVVGNIGSQDRKNYTLVGDAVNVANRLEQLGKLYLGDGESVVMASSDTWEAAGKPDFMLPRGYQKLRGRESLIAVYAMGDGLLEDVDPVETKISV